MLSDLAEQSYRINARWVFPDARTAIERGSIVVVNGTIADIQHRPIDDAIDLGNVALLPGLVNAHTHLEFSHLKTPLQPNRPFTGWIDAIIACRQQGAAGHSPGTNRAPLIQAGLHESRGGGVTTIGEIDTLSDQECFPVTDPPARGIRFRELIGLDPGQRSERLEMATRFLDQSLGDGGESRWKPGLSPHAPYSVHFQLLEEVVQLAVDQQVPLAMHWSETPAERALIESQTGEFVEFLKNRGLWNPTWFDSDLRLLDYLKQLSQVETGLVIHGNYMTTEETDFLADHSQLSVVYCPRTHAYFGHAPHPWQELLNRGVNVALGTDSRASNPSLNLFDELRFLCRQFPKVAPATFLEMATRGGARALGLQSQVGTLEVGRAADLALVSLPDGPGNDPYALLLSDESAILATTVDGRPV